MLGPLNLAFDLLLFQVSCDLLSGNAEVTLLKPKLTCFSFMTTKHETPSNKVDLGNKFKCIFTSSQHKVIKTGGS